MKIPLEIPVFSIHHGSARVIAALGIHGNLPAFEYLKELKSSNLKGFKILYGQIIFLSDVPTIRPRDRFKLLDASRNLYEFRCKSGLRLYCFLDGNDLILLTNGGKKNTPKEQSKDIEKAKIISDEYSALRKSGGKLKWIRDENESA